MAYQSSKTGAQVDASLALADTAVQAAVLVDTKEPTGFLDPTAIAVAYNDANRTITLTQSGGVVYYWRGEKKTLASPWTSIAHDVGDGLWFLSSTDGTNFTWATSPWSFSDIQVSVVLNLGAVKFALREVHGLIPWQTHLALHNRVGTYRDSGGTLDEATFAYATATDAATTPGFTEATVIDEDLSTVVPASPEGVYTTVRAAAGGSSTFEVAADFPFRVADPEVANTYLLVNDPETGDETAAIDDRFYNVYDFLMPVASDSESQKYRRVMLQPQRAHGSLAAARDEDPLSLSLVGGPLAPEFVLNARITYHTQSAATNTGKCVIPTGGVTYVTGSLMSQMASGGYNPKAAQNVLFDPSGRISATDVQGAIEELDTSVVYSDPTGVTGADAITNMMSLTQAEYDAIGAPNASTIYVITD
jgi:hypothetical protein